ncbi:MAG: glycosyltransferase [Pseudomonadota bacterium]
MTGRVVLWVQHLLGTGHLRRSAAIARATAAQGLDVTLLSGGMPVPHLDLGAARLVQLTPLRAIDESFSGLALASGDAATPRDLDTRRDEARALMETTKPDLLITETFPFGRRQLRDEALALIERARAGGATTAVSVRDILQRQTKPGRYEEMLALALRHIDHVMVHGDPRLVPFDLTFPLAGQLGERLRYTGYIAGKTARREAGGPGDGEIIVSVGGGATGAPLLAAALDARAAAAAAGNRVWRLLVGHDLMAGDLASRLTDPPSGVVVEEARPDFAALLANCAVSVSQAGYNTAVDILAAGARSVLVPFARGGETEQRDRAERLADLGVAIMVEEAALSPERLAAAVDDALAGAPPDPAGFDLDGAAKSAALITEWASRG